AVPYDPPQDVASMLVPVHVEALQSRIPIRLIHREAHAGFYSSAWGLLPFAISRQPVEEITIRQVNYLSERLPEIRLEGAAEGETILPVPAPGGGVDIVVPAPSHLRIPYEDALPVRVQFSCVVPGGAAGNCPIHVSRERTGVQAEV